MVREITGLGLKEAKDLVDGARRTSRKAFQGLADAEAAKKKLEEAGAKVELPQSTRCGAGRSLRIGLSLVVVIKRTKSWL